MPPLFTSPTESTATEQEDAVAADAIEGAAPKLLSVVAILRSMPAALEKYQYARLRLRIDSHDGRGGVIRARLKSHRRRDTRTVELHYVSKINERVLLDAIPRVKFPPYIEVALKWGRR